MLTPNTLEMEHSIMSPFHCKECMQRNNTFDNEHL